MLKIYLQDPIQAGIAPLVKEAGIVVWEKAEDVDLVSLNRPGLGLLEKANGIIVEITEPGEQVNYILAQAVLQQKPTLCLYQKNKEPRHLLIYLKRRGVPRSLQVKAYTKDTLSNIVVRFLQDLGLTKELAEKPNIKFTLRITENIQRYLDWKSRQSRKNKADYLRELVEKEMNSDKNFQDNLKT